jgi:surface antigen
MMKKRLVGVLLALAMAFSLLGCASKTGTGALIGGGAGALAGGLIGGRWGTLIGSVFGAAVGAGIGYGLDQQDRARAAYVLENTPTHSTQEWINPDTGARYRMTPVETYPSEAGRPCREFTLEGYVGGEPEEVWGTACRQPDGSWRIVESAPT